MPPITAGGIDSGVETGIDPEGGLVTAYVYDPDGDDFTLVVVDYRDERCRAHPVMGPIIDHLLATVEPPISPLPTAPPRADLIGPFELASVAGRCPILRDAQGEIWELRLPYDYTFTTEGVLKILDVFGEVHAVECDTIAVNGRPTEDGFSVCMVGTPFEITRIVFVDPASP